MSTLPDPEGRKLLRIEVRNSQTPIEKKPEWIRTTAKAGENYQDMRSLSHAKGLHTVCAEAGCPNIYECWQDREATFLLGGACARAAATSAISRRAVQRNTTRTSRAVLLSPCATLTCAM